MTETLVHSLFTVPTVLGVSVKLNSHIEEFIKDITPLGYNVILWDKTNRYNTYVVVKQGIPEEEIKRRDQLVVVVTTTKGRVLKVTYGNSIGTKLTDSLKKQVNLENKEYSHYIENHKESLLTVLESELNLPKGSLVYISKPRFTMGKNVHLAGYVLSKEPLDKRYLLLTILENSFISYCLSQYELITENRALKYLDFVGK